MLQGPRTIGRLFKQRLQKSPDHYAIGWIENNEVKNMTFTDYRNQIEILVNGLKKIGVSPGDKVSILAQTCREWHFLDFATQISRGCVVPIYPSYLSHEIAHIFNHSDSNVLVVENDKQMEKIIPIIKDLTNLKTVISINELMEDTLKKFRNSYPYFSYKELVRIGLDESKAHPDHFENQIQSQQPEEIATIIYTSGTTGEPKGAVITQHALTTMLLNVEKTVKASFTASDRTLTFLPLSHVMGRCDSFLPLVFGWQSVYAESMEKIIDNIQIVRPTVMMSVPRVFEKIYTKVNEQVEQGSLIEKQAFRWASAIAEKYFSKIDRDLSPSALEIIEYRLAYKVVFSKIYNRFGGRIRYFVSGGAPLSPQIIKFLRYANLTILEGYGLTETIAPCCLNPLSKQVAGTVGRPMGDVEISFANDGEILIRTEAMLKEYYKNPNATAEAIQNGWFHSGDIGEFSADGYLKITDRKKDLIITSGGKNVAPQKIENMAKTKPHISQMVVIGDGRNYLTALVGIDKDSFLNNLDHLNLPTDCSVEDIAQHPDAKAIIQKEIDEVNLELAQFETVKKFEIVAEEFTTENFLTPSLKVKRKAISEHYKKQIEAMYH
jgi:long-chain acyl-CoA synthetase